MTRRSSPPSILTRRATTTASAGGSTTGGPTSWPSVCCGTSRMPSLMSFSVGRPAGPRWAPPAGL
eukprot:15482825-Alexandrium_andersonii.AAC.1